MRASVQWLRSLVPALEATDEDIAARLARGGFDVRIAAKLDGDLRGLALGKEEIPEGSSLQEVVPSAFDTILQGPDPDRADLFGHVGLARETAALFRLPFEPPGVDAPSQVAEGTVEMRVDVEVLDAAACPHFGVIVVEAVRVAPSPLWLRARLHALGIAPVFNVVDLANLVMLESGIPVSAWDLDRIEGTLSVGTAPGQRLEHASTEIVLDETDLVVTDTLGPVSLAGVADARRVWPGPDTRRIVLACGKLDPTVVSRAADRHGLDTEASRRHRRGVDRHAIVEVLSQAGSLATRLAGGTAVPGSLHVFDEPWYPSSFVLSPDMFDLRVTLDRAKDLLPRLGFEVTLLRSGDGHDGLQATVPSFRPDIDGPAGIRREILRVLDAGDAA